MVGSGGDDGGEGEGTAYRSRSAAGRVTASKKQAGGRFSG